jgi:ATP-dependent exoDNAse (exonuclease V) beta subunit
MRTVTGRAHQVASVLDEQGIPAFADAPSGFFDRAEVAWLMAALQLVDKRWRDVPMIAALHSPMAGLTLDELLAIRGAHREESFFCGAVFSTPRKGRRTDGRQSPEFSGAAVRMENRRPAFARRELIGPDSR